MPRTAPYKAKHNHDQSILDGMTKYPWSSHWGDQQEEKGISLSGVNLTDAAPNPPGWAKTWAKKLADAIVDANHASLETLYLQAKEICGYPHDPESFGGHLGMEAIGSGIRWTDDTSRGELQILVPDMQFYQGANPDLRFMRGKIR